MNSFAHKTNPREAQYARFALAVLATIRSAVSRRVEEGLTQKQLAKRLGISESALSHLVRGRVSNITLRTLSDVLWATDHEPVQFYADPVEDLKGAAPEHFCANVSTERLPTVVIGGSLGRTAPKPVKRWSIDA